MRESLGEYTAGDDLLLTFTVTDENGDAVNISGATCRFVLVPWFRRTAVVSTESAPATATASITSAAGGIYTIAIAAADTEDLLGVYYVESEVEDSSGDIVTVNRSQITVLRNRVAA